MGKSLNDIKRDISLLTMDIESLDPGSKLSAISHLEETIDLLKTGVEHENKDDSSENREPWLHQSFQFEKLPF